jgi:anti-sigma regulatory factor (Ser/Thr protein kinase)
MAMTGPPPIAVRDASQVGTVRRAAIDLASVLGFDEHDRARVALIATEMSTNLVKHARDGEVIVQIGSRGPLPVLELIALDPGPGIVNVGYSMQDGTSTSGTPGTGLGAIRRVATRFDIYSTPEGTAVLAEIAAPGARGHPSFEVGAVSVPYPGEHVCGDGFAVAQDEGRAIVLVVDGLGHGPVAATAAARAAELFASHSRLAPVELMQRLHDGLRSTRGAAAALAEVDARRGLVRFCGVGNIAATILAGGATRSLVSHHGTLGHQARKIAEFQYPWTADSQLILNSDGLVSNWTLGRYPGLADRAASLIAAILYRDCRRQRDDVTVLVLRGKA